MVTSVASVSAGDVVTAPSAENAMYLDFDRLERPDSPNHWLIAPVGTSPQPRTDVQAAVFDVTSARLAEAWLGVVRSQPRTTILAVSDDGLRVEAEQRSALFGFVDTISFQAVAVAAGKSSFIAYSRSQVGYWDMGVNKGRLRDWSAALRRALGDGLPH